MWLHSSTQYLPKIDGAVAAASAAFSERDMKWFASYAFYNFST